MKVDFTQNLDTSSGFTTGTFPVGQRPYGISGYNPDGPRWTCAVTITSWDKVNSTTRAHAFEYGARNGQTFKLPSWWQGVLPTTTGTPTADQEVVINVAMRGNAIGKLHYLAVA